MSTLQPQKIATPETRDSRAAANGLAKTLFLMVTVLIVPGLLAYGFGTINELQIFAVVFGLIGAAVILAKPFWGLIFFVALLYTRPEESLPALAGMHFTLIVAVVTLTGMLLQSMLNRIPMVRTPFIGMMIGFAVAGMVSGAVAGNLSDAAMDFARLVVLVMLILNLVRTPDRYQAFVTAIIVFTCYLALYSIYLFLTGVAVIDNGTVGGLARSKGTGIFSDPNDLAATIVAGLALTLTRIVQKRRYARAFYIVLFVCMLWAIQLTNSRGGLLALLTMIGIFCLVFARRKGLAIILAVGLTGLLVVAAPGRMTNFDNQEESANSRLYAWEVGLTQLRLYPLTGVGYQKFSDVNAGHVAHNSFVTCFAELGFPAFFCWMGCIYLAFRRSDPVADQGDGKIPVSQELAGARLGLTGLLTAGFWITRTYAPNLYVFLSLPVAQQIAATGQHILPIYCGAQKGKTYARILTLCLGMLVLIMIMITRK